MKLTMTEISIHKEDQSPIFGEDVTRVRLADEGGGYFIELVQEDNRIRLDFDEITHILKAIERLKDESNEL